MLLLQLSLSRPFYLFPRVIYSAFTPNNPIPSYLLLRLIFFALCPLLSSLDLSAFYFWIKDIPIALHAYPSFAAALSSLDLHCPAISNSFTPSELIASPPPAPTSPAFVPLAFNPMHFNFVGDDALLALASDCPNLALLHLVDPTAMSRNHHHQQQQADSGIGVARPVQESSGCRLKYWETGAPG